MRKARADSDTVIVFLHWGTERSQCPNPQQQELAVALQLGRRRHHRGQPRPRAARPAALANAFVDYGLGNYFFYATVGNRADTGVVKVTATGRRIDGYEFLPAHISGGQARSLTGSAATAATTAWNALRSVHRPHPLTSLEPAPTALPVTQIDRKWTSGVTGSGRSRESAGIGSGGARHLRSLAGDP